MRIKLLFVASCSARVELVGDLAVDAGPAEAGAARVAARAAVDVVLGAGLRPEQRQRDARQDAGHDPVAAPAVAQSVRVLAQQAREAERPAQA